MLKNAVRRLTLCCLLLPAIVVAETESGELVIAQNVPGQSYRFADGKMAPGEERQLEITYRILGDKITRAKVYDIVKKEVIADDTTFTIEAKAKQPDGTPLIRAIGKSGNGPSEILEIGGTFVQSVRSNDGEIVIARMKRTDTVALPDIPGGEPVSDEAVPLAEDKTGSTEAQPTPAALTPAEQKAWEDGHASGLSLSKTGKFENPFPENGPANERQAWFKGFKEGLNVEAKKENASPGANRAEAGE